MNENYLKYKYYASRCEMADEYKKITGEELQPLGENMLRWKKKWDNIQWNKRKIRKSKRKNTRINR